MRVRATPLLPCRRHGKKRNGKDAAEDAVDEPPAVPVDPPPPPPPATKKETKKSKAQQKALAAAAATGDGTTVIPSTPPATRAETPVTPLTPASNGTMTPNTNINSPSANSAFSAPVNQNPLMNSNSNLINMASMIDNFTDAQLQSNQISSTVLDSPYSYDYTTGSYIDKRTFFNQQWMTPGMEYGAYPDREQMKSRGSEENPDSTTLTNANNSAFSPSVPADITKLHDVSADAYGNKEQGFVKPKAPEYTPTYGYHHPTTPSYPMYPSYPTPTYNQPHHYNNLDYYGNDKMRYNFYNHTQSYNPYDIYHTHPQAPTATQAMPPAPQTPPPNWNIYPPVQSANIPTTVASPLPPVATRVPTPPPPPTTQPPPASNAPTPVIEDDQTPIKSEPIGEITEINENIECFQDTQLGGIGIALEHGSVLIECAKHEMHATTALRKPNRLDPTRITLIFYQHRNLNRHRHGIDDWEEKMRLKKLDAEAALAAGEPIETKKSNKGGDKKSKAAPEPLMLIKEETCDDLKEDTFDLDVERVNQESEDISMRAPQMPLTPMPNHLPIAPVPHVQPTPWGPPQYVQPTWPPPI